MSPWRARFNPAAAAAGQSSKGDGADNELGYSALHDVDNACKSIKEFSTLCACKRRPAVASSDREAQNFPMLAGCAEAGRTADVKQPVLFERQGRSLMLRALTLARQIEADGLTPADLLGRCAEAIAAREPDVRAFAAIDVEAALQEASRSGSTLARLPLRGLPVGVKDNFDTADWPTEYGSPIYAGNRPRGDAALVTDIRRAGGLVLGKTVTTEFAFMHPGPTRNPHNLDHTPGGSSSGSAAAVAAGMVPIAIGSQTAGSVIRPAAFCGIAAIKPSYSLLPTVGMKCFAWHLDTPGVFAATVADVAFAIAAITGRDLRVDREPPAAPRLALLRTHLWDKASDAMRAAVERSANAAAAAGARLTQVELPPMLVDAFDAQAVIQSYEAYRALGFEHDRCADRLSPRLRQMLDEASGISVKAYDAARRTTRHARSALLDLMNDVDAFITPSAPGAAPRGLESTGVPIFNRLWTLMGTPCVNVPGLLDEAQLPLGVQIVGRFGQDRTALSAAAFVEAAIGRAQVS
jgi:Asp-tRNA(Asn)/Glu-tRNA(Gln) amidotransferase A subunit family amidase